MQSIEDRYEKYIIENKTKKEYLIRPSLEEIINELIDVKYSQKKLKVKASLKTNETIKKLKLLRRRYSKKDVGLSMNLKKRLILKDMLELIENQESYIKRLDEVITFKNYDEVILLMKFLDNEFDNNFRYLSFLMDYIQDPKKAFEKLGSNSDIEDTRSDVKEFFEERYGCLMPKPKQKQKQL